MSSSQTGCKIETNDEVTRQVALAMGITGVICLALSIVGLIAELVFVCKKKNNFLLRLYIYLSVTVLLVHVTDTLYLFILVDPQNDWLCKVIEGVAFYPAMVEFLFIISINCVLLHKVYTSVRTSCYHCHGSKANEVLFVIVHFLIPLIIISVLLWSARTWPTPHECHTFYKNVVDCNSGHESEHLFKIATEWIPVAIDILLSILCVCTLSVWCCWLLQKQFLRARMKTILKEMGLLLGFLSSYCIIRVVLEIMTKSWGQNSVKMLITNALYPINRVTIPFSFIIYLCFVYLCPPRSDQNSNPRTDQHTHPPSTRVSLPSNTADRALNFLSKSELISSSHKNSKRAPTETTALLLN